MGKDFEIQKLEKQIEKAKDHEAKRPLLKKLKELDPNSKLWEAHKPGGKFYSGELKSVKVEHTVEPVKDSTKSGKFVRSNNPKDAVPSFGVDKKEIK